jgi:hypothetical protein
MRAVARLLAHSPSVSIQSSRRGMLAAFVAVCNHKRLAPRTLAV